MSEEQSEVKQVLPNRSESIGNLVKALAAAQKEYKPLKKSSINPFYTTDKKVAKYAELADVIEATQSALASHGLTVLQLESTELDMQTAIVETVLAHESGEWMSSKLSLPAVGKGYNNVPRFDAQTIGAAMREIISVGPAWATEEGNKVVVPTLADQRMLTEMQKAYHAGYERGKRDADAGFISGLVWASVVWVVFILFARAI